jgi:hypothetical protein
MKHTHDFTKWIAEPYLNFESRICKICQHKETRSGKPVKAKK